MNCGLGDFQRKGKLATFSTIVVCTYALKCVLEIFRMLPLTILSVLVVCHVCSGFSTAMTITWLKTNAAM